jgi:hypothetical protein
MNEQKPNKPIQAGRFGENLPYFFTPHWNNSKKGVELHLKRFLHFKQVCKECVNGKN